METESHLRFSCRPLASAGPWRRPAHEDLFAIEILDEHTDALALSALCLISEEFDLRSNRQAGPRNAVPEQVARGAALDSPVHHGAVLAFDVDPDPRVGIDQFHFCHRALQVDWLVLVKRRGKRVMSP